MKVIARPRGGGKTTEVIKLSAESGAYIVCHNIHEVERVAALAKELGLDINYPITSNEFIHHSDGSPFVRKPVIIDNIELFLEYTMRYPIGTITVSIDE